MSRKRNAQSESSAVFRKHKKSIRTKSDAEYFEGIRQRFTSVGTTTSTPTPSIIVTSPTNLLAPTQSHTNYAYRVSNSSSLPVETAKADNNNISDIIILSQKSSQDYREESVLEKQHYVNYHSIKVQSYGSKENNSEKTIPPQIYVHLCCFLITLPTGIVLMMISLNPVNNNYKDQIDELHMVVTAFLRCISIILILIGLYNIVAAFKVRSMPTEYVIEDSSGYESKTYDSRKHYDQNSSFASLKQSGYYN